MDQNNNYKQKLMDALRENYLSIALGFLVFLIAITLIFRSAGDLTTENIEGTGEETGTETAKTYVVKPGDSVSSIARDQLGSMEHTQALIDANNIKNPDLIEVGMKLALPEITPIMTIAPTQMESAITDGGTMTNKITITGSSYTVKKGDHLWNIAERAYGNGNMYTKILEANTLKNPDRLEEGTVLKLPR